MEAVVGLWGAWTATGLAAEWVHRRSVRAIPHRFLCCGMRGKSSLTRLLHEALGIAGVPSMARITGDRPELIHSDGQVATQRRIGPPNIRELRRVMRRAARERCEAVCVENMAVNPDLVKVVASHVVMPTVCLFAWDAPDHFEHYSSDRFRRAKQIAELLPRTCPVVLIDSPRNVALAEELKAKCMDVRLAGSRGLERADSLAAAVHEALGISGLSIDQEELRRMAEKYARVDVYTLDGKRYVDLLSANDPESTRILMDEFETKVEGRADERRALVYFHRGDRAERAVSFFDLFAAMECHLAGDPVPANCRKIYSKTMVVTPPELRSIDADVLFLVGNAKGMGECVREYLAEHGVRESW